MQAFFSYNDRIKTILEDTTMKVSVIQMNMRSLESKANFDRAEALVRRAVGENGPDVVVLPETWNTGFMPAGDLAAASDENAKAVRARFSPLARELNVNIVAGSVSNRRGGKIYNTACVFDRAGACIAEYDKTHPFTPMGEHEVYTPGDHLVTFTLDSVRCGLLICYEVRFPELWRTLALRGAQVMFLPAQWTAARQYHWETLTAARAIENQLFVVSCNACGERDGTLYGGFFAHHRPAGRGLSPRRRGRGDRHRRLGPFLHRAPPRPRPRFPRPAARALPAVKRQKPTAKEASTEMKITLLASFLVMAAYFLLLYAGVGLIQEKKFFSYAPREVFAAVPERKAKRFRGAHILGWYLGILAMLLFLGAAVLAAWDGVRNGVTFGAFFARYLVILYVMEAYDILFFRLGAAVPFELLSSFLPRGQGHRCPAAVRVQQKAHLTHFLLYIPLSAALAWVCTLF